MINNLPAALLRTAQELLEHTQYNDMLFEGRIDYLKSRNPTIDTSHESTPIHTDADKIIDHISNAADPTQKKLFTNWILNQYKNKAFKQEDAYKMKDTLENFHKYSGRLPQKDILSYKSIKDVEAAVKPHLGLGATKKEDAAVAKQTLHQPGHELKYDDDNISIYHLSDKDVSKKLYARSNDKHPGAIPTEWCTATENDDHNRFDQYLSEYPDSKYHVVHRKADGAVFQYHPDSNQFMDAKDESINHEDFKSIAPSLHKAWREKPELI